MKKDDVIDTINDLIETSRDGEYGFDQCAKYAASTELKNVFRMRGAECHLAAEELSNLVTELGGHVEEGGTIGGAMHRGWVSVRSTVTNDEDLAMLEECERGEDTAKDRYGKALKEDLPEPVRKVVSRQYQGVLSNHAEIHALRDRYGAGRPRI